MNAEQPETMSNVGEGASIATAPPHEEPRVNGVFQLPERMERPKMVTMDPPTLEQCVANAKNYPNRTSWCLNSPRLYKAAGKNGWMKECCAHMTGDTQHKPMGYWTKERCAEFANQCTTRTGWAKFNNASYNAARKAGWFEELTRHMGAPLSVNTRNKRRTKKEMVAAKKVATPKSKVVRLDEVHPKKAVIHKPIKIAAQPIKMARGVKRVWTKSETIASAKKYANAHQWRLMDSGAYRAAKRNGWVKEATAHMKPSNVKFGIGHWTLYRVAKEAKVFGSKIEWAAYHPWSYNAARINGWIDEVTKHMIKTNFGPKNRRIVPRNAPTPQPASIVKTTKQATPKKVAPKKMATKTIASRKIATKSASDAFEFAIANASMMPRGYWNLQRVRTVAKRYPSRLAWRKATPHIYDIATFKGWLKSCSKHMTDSLRMVYHPTAVQKQSARKARAAKAAKHAAKLAARAQTPVATVASIKAAPPISTPAATVEAPARVPIAQAPPIPAAPVATSPAPEPVAQATKAAEPQKKTLWKRLTDLF